MYNSKSSSTIGAGSFGWDLVPPPSGHNRAARAPGALSQYHDAVKTVNLRDMTRDCTILSQVEQLTGVPVEVVEDPRPQQYTKPLEVARLGNAAQHRGRQ